MNKEFKVVDLTHTLSPEILTWDGSCGFEMATTLDYADCTHPDLFRKHSLKMECGIGTHIDAPAHVVLDGRTVDKLIMEELVTGCIVIDVSSEAHENYMIMPEVVEKFEKKYGEIKSNSFVIFYTGWDKHWNDTEKYNNNHKFPSVDISTAKLLMERNIAGLGIDTLSADTGINGFPVHREILGADKYLVENVANARELPSSGSRILVLPMKIKDGTEAPVRLVAFI